MHQTERRILCDLPKLLLPVLLTSAGLFAQFRDTRQLTSNSITALAGSGDTLWLATERGFNYKLDINSDEWYGFETDDIGLNLLAFGNGHAAALLQDDKNEPLIWSFNHATKTQSRKLLAFSKGIRDRNNYAAGGILHFQNSFWAAYNEGGLIQFTPASGSVQAIVPGKAPVSPDKLVPDSLSPQNTTVQSVSLLDSNKLLITTPKMLWTYNPAEKSWDTLASGGQMASGETFDSFKVAFTPLRGNPDVVYAYIKTKKTENGLYRFGKASGKWSKVLTKPPLFISSAVGGYFYALFEENQLATFNDTLSDSADVTTPLKEVQGSSYFRSRISSQSEGVYPSVNDILFLPQSDTSGTLIFATGGGLYIADSEAPLSGSEGDMRLIRYTRKISSSDCYALPGIIRASDDNRYDRAVFVYRLKKDGNVTIRVYDYNMSPVKTVVDGESRKAETSVGRSTDPERDYWDGTNQSGRKVAPGVYYFKVTSTGGDRHFGKIILAK